MDSFFGIGLPELLLILILAGLVMGPHRIRQVARTLGRITAQLQRVSREFARQLNSELDAVDSGEMRDAIADMRSLQNEVEALRRELSQVPSTLKEVTDAAATEGRKVLAESDKAPEISKDSMEQSAPTIQVEQKPAGESNTAVQDRPPLPNPLNVPGDPEV
jgi:Sec-independent protein translocase protein TatA